MPDISKTQKRLARSGKLALRPELVLELTPVFVVILLTNIQPPRGVKNVRIRKKRASGVMASVGQVSQAPRGMWVMSGRTMPPLAATVRTGRTYSTSGQFRK